MKYIISKYDFCCNGVGLCYNKGVKGERTMTKMERKYQNGQEIVNKKGVKFLGEYDFYKIVIKRKEKSTKTDTCVRYNCSVYMKKDDEYGQSWVLKETTIDKVVE